MGDYVCWTRMQAEAGQTLDAIVARKELERQAGEGLFMWGVGSAPSRAIRPLAQLGRRIPVIFSIMKSKPKVVDVAPSRVVVWRRYTDKEGVVRPLPAHCIVTSRADSARGPKQAHYALMCWSDAPLRLRSGVKFNVASFRNAGPTGSPVGASQVTALLQAGVSAGSKPGYEINMAAELIESYWVRLADPLEVNRDGQAALAHAHDFSLADWRDLAHKLRSIDDDAPSRSEELMLI